MASLESCNPSLLGAMDSLWFHKVVLCSESNICPNKSSVEILNPSLPSSTSSPSSSSKSQPSPNSSSEPTDYSDYDIIQDFAFALHGSLPTILTTHHQNDSEDEDDNKERLKQKGREDGIKELTPKRPNLVCTPIRNRIKTMLKLERTISLKTLAELEQEEVKGFMDLGFSFDKDRLTPRMMSVIPGLQRLQVQEDEEDEDKDKDENVNAKQEEDVEIVKREDKIKPYLSEAWLIKRPNSPLVRLRMSRPFTTSSDMKKNLKLWAKTVACSAIKDS